MHLKRVLSFQRQNSIFQSQIFFRKIKNSLNHCRCNPALFSDSCYHASILCCCSSIDICQPKKDSSIKTSKSGTADILVNELGYHNYRVLNKYDAFHETEEKLKERTN